MGISYLSATVYKYKTLGSPGIQNIKLAFLPGCYEEKAKKHLLLTVVCFVMFIYSDICKEGSLVLLSWVSNKDRKALHT